MLLDPRFSLIDELVKEINKNRTSGQYLSKNHIKDCQVEMISPQSTYSSDLSIEEINNLIGSNSAYHNKKAILTTIHNQEIIVTYHAIDINLLYKKKIGNGNPPVLSGFLSENKVFDYFEDHFGLLRQHLEMHYYPGISKYEKKRIIKAKMISPYSGEIEIYHPHGFYYKPSLYAEANMSSAYANRDTAIPANRFSLHYYDNITQVTMKHLSYIYNQFVEYYSEYTRMVDDGFMREIGGRFYYHPRGLSHRTQYVCLPKEYPLNKLIRNSQELRGDVNMFHYINNKCYNFSGNSTSSLSTEDSNMAIGENFAKVVVIPSGVYNLERNHFEDLTVNVLVIQNTLVNVNSAFRDRIFRTLKKIYINDSWSVKNLYQAFYPLNPAPSSEEEAIAHFDNLGIEVLSIPMGD